MHCTSEFHFNNVSVNDVQKSISNLKTKSSFGHDGISTKLLKKINDIISPPLTLVINQSLNTGIFPDTLKVAKVMPLLKKGDNNLLNNYRPISLLPAISKVFEKIVYRQIYSYLEQHNLLLKSQYGFRTDHSTELAGLEFVDRILHDMDNKQFPLAIFLDLSKAFDTLDHTILLTKLKHYGILGVPLKWFTSYLSNRKQYVQLDSVKSNLLDIKTGVPQGSILGPLLFIIYMNDIKSASDRFDLVLYADDTTLNTALGSITQNCTNLVETSHIISNELNKIYLWLNANRLSLNFEKKKYMIFQRQHKKARTLSLDIKINDYSVEQVEEFDFLGLTINSNLNWTSHINKISTKISRAIGIINKLKHFLPLHTLKTIYNTLVSPHIYFCITAWGFNLKRILKLQKKAIRVISLSKYNSHTDPLFKQLSILRVDHIFQCQCLKLYHKITNNKAPSFFKSMFYN